MQGQNEKPTHNKEEKDANQSNNNGPKMSANYNVKVWSIRTLIVKTQE